MVKKILKWIALFLTFKLLFVLVVAQLGLDPRRDIATRERLCQKFDPNVVFIGTSRTLYGVNPALFDSLNAGKTRSYNMGLFSISFAHALQIAENLIENERKTNTIFIELSALDYSTMHLTPNQLFQDVYFRSRATGFASNMDDKEKVSEFLTDLNLTLFQIFSIAPQIAAIKKLVKPVKDPIEGPPHLQDNGFQIVVDTLTGVNTMLINNQFYTKKLITTDRKSTPNLYYLSRINGIIALARSHGKSVVFFMPNNFTKGEFETLSHVMPYIPEANLISLPKDSRMDAIFKPVNLFDPHHLNMKGSAIYTTYLHAQFIQKSHVL
ncbi:hypothetical protein [Dyadobacter sp. CY326]|uniref:hypothetical protein n=1 Tax=Dyadobacter sp. CY326 TaxID=2907300 RepID=UPI001F286860|nr:hypothetical protein [Dyadobacter sp. CY326]MCE7068129.1 hypothetical protein [Dyadobacter sp. CY326]